MKSSEFAIGVFWGVVFSALTFLFLVVLLAVGN